MTECSSLQVCVSCLCHCCDKLSDNSTLKKEGRKEGPALCDSLRIRFITAEKAGHEVAPGHAVSPLGRSNTQLLSPVY